MVLTRPHQPEYGLGSFSYNKGTSPMASNENPGDIDPADLVLPSTPNPLNLEEFDFPEAAPSSFDDPDGDVFIS